MKEGVFVTNIDLSKLDIAITYIQRMAEGLDPVKNIQVEDDCVINNPNVIRCMYFVQNVLMEVRKNDGVIGSKKRTGKELGIYLEERTSMRGENYNVVMYDQKAQEFLVHNLEAIVNGEIVTEEGCESNHM